MIPRGLIIIAPTGALWVAYHFVGSILCWYHAPSRSEAIDGLVSWIDANLVCILSTDPTLHRALATVH